MMKKTVIALGVATLAGASMVALPQAVAGPASVEGGLVQIAACNPCSAKKNPCNPCAAKTNPCAAKANPCAAKANPCNPCAAKKKM